MDELASKRLCSDGTRGCSARKEKAGEAIARRERGISVEEIHNVFEKFGNIEEAWKGRKRCVTDETFTTKSAAELTLSKNTPPLAGRFSSTTIHNLPNELLDFIFSFLCVRERIQIELVCRRWRKIGKTLPWGSPKTLELIYSEKFPPLTNYILSSVLSRCGTCLKLLYISSFCSMGRLSTKTAMSVISKYCPNLVGLKIDGMPSEKESLAKHYLSPLVSGCLKLKYLSVQNDNFTDDCMSKFFIAMASGSGRETLEGLCLRNSSLTGRCFRNVHKDTKLLCLHECDNLKVNAILRYLTKRCTGIRHLSLIDSYRVNGDVLVSVLDRYKTTLQTFRLDGHARNLPKEWCDSLRLLYNIEQLTLNKCRAVKDRIMKSIANMCPKLSVLKINDTRVTDVGVSSLAAASFLKVLDISGTLAKGAGIANLAVQGQLEELYARDMPEDNVVQQNCGSLATFCSGLRVLDVSATNNITNELVEEFRSSVKKCFFKSPLYLCVGGTMVDKNLEEENGLRLIFKTNYIMGLSSDPFISSPYVETDEDASDQNYETDSSDGFGYW